MLLQGRKQSVYCERGRDMYRNILVATDGSDLAAIAVRNGVALAKILADPNMMAAAETAYVQGANLVASKALDVAADAAKAAGIDCETVHVIVMASHGRHGISALVLGSETLKVLTHSKIPVLVYR
jgi:nucleotide-binding universal stress UspA family protein